MLVIRCNLHTSRRYYQWLIDHAVGLMEVGTTTEPRSASDRVSLAPHSATTIQYSARV